jgi:hypothetical protein
MTGTELRRGEARQIIASDWRPMHPLKLASGYSTLHVELADGLVRYCLIVDEAALAAWLAKLAAARLAKRAITGGDRLPVAPIRVVVR